MAASDGTSGWNSNLPYDSSGMDSHGVSGDGAAGDIPGDGTDGAAGDATVSCRHCRTEAPMLCGTCLHRVALPDVLEVARKAGQTDSEGVPWRPAPKGSGGQAGQPVKASSSGRVPCNDVTSPRARAQLIQSWNRPRRPTPSERGIPASIGALDDADRRVEATEAEMHAAQSYLFSVRHVNEPMMADQTDPLSPQERRVFVELQEAAAAYQHAARAHGRAVASRDALVRQWDGDWAPLGELPNENGDYGLSPRDRSGRGY